VLDGGEENISMVDGALSNSKMARLDMESASKGGFGIRNVVLFSAQAMSVTRMSAELSMKVLLKR
jgi:hypothetical protein